MKELSKTDIKKYLYKEKPTANLIGKVLFNHVDGSKFSLRYESEISTGDKLVFFVSENESKGAEFKTEMPAHELIRWLYCEHN